MATEHSNDPTSKDAQEDRFAALRDDQLQRWHSGQRPMVEDYLKQHPELSEDHETVLDLVFAEYMMRQYRGENPTLIEYQARFPHLAGLLEIQLEVDSLIDSRIGDLAAPPRLTPAPAHHLQSRSGDRLIQTPLSPSRSSLNELVREERRMAGLPAEISGGPNPSVHGYEILSVLGRGGMGIVYKARQLNLNRTVAVKMVLAGQNARPDLLARFQSEAEFIASLQHPNIVQVFEVGQEDGVPYLTLEMADGGSLESQLDGTPRPIEESARLVEVLARAVAHAHSRSIVHRDLKPANVLFTTDGNPKITDFGLAKMLGTPSGHTQPGHVLGTPCYMAPEQAGDSPLNVGPEADIYSLGAILYELITGRPPFRAATTAITIQQVLYTDPMPPGHLRGELPRDLETIILRCLRKNPKKRFASALELADDLKRFLAGEAIVSKPIPVRTRVRRWIVRHPGRAAMAAVGSLIALAVPAFLAVLWLGTMVRLKDAENRLAEFSLTLAERDRDREIEQARFKTLQSVVSSTIRDVQQGNLGIEDLFIELGAGKPSTELLKARKQALMLAARPLREILNSSQNDLADITTDARKALVTLLRRQAIVDDALGQEDQADLATREAFQIEMASLQQPPQTPARTYEITQNWRHQGHVYLREHNGHRALQFFIFAADGYDKLGSLPDLSDYLTKTGLTAHELRMGMAEVTHEAAVLYAEMNNLGEAISIQKRSIHAIRDEIRATGANADQSMLAKALIRLADLANRAGRSKEFPDIDQEARTILVQILGPDRGIPKIMQNEEWVSLSQRGDLLEWLGRSYSHSQQNEDAIQNFQRAAELQEAVITHMGPPVAKVVTSRLRSHLIRLASLAIEVKKPEVALEAARRLAEDFPDQPSDQFEAARLMALAYEQGHPNANFKSDEVAKELIDHLRTALKLGLDRPKALENPAFDPLRQRPDFLELKPEPAKAQSDD